MCVTEVGLVGETEMNVFLRQGVLDLVGINACRQTRYDLLHACDVCIVKNIVVDEHVVSQECELAIGISRARVQNTQNN